MTELQQFELEIIMAQIDQSLIFYLPIVVFTFLSFNLTQNLRSAINEGQKVRVLPKVLVSIFCTFILLISCFLLLGIISTAHMHFGSDYVTYMRLLLAFHIFIYFFQLVMIWYPKPK